MLEEGLTGNEGNFSSRVTRLLYSMGMGVINKEYSKNGVLRVVYVSKANIKSSRITNPELYKQRTDWTDIVAIQFKEIDDGNNIERKGDSLLQLELKTGSHYPHNNRWSAHRFPGSVNKPRGYPKDLKLVVNGSVDALCCAVDETFYRTMTGDDYRPNLNRRRGNSASSTLKDLLPSMDELIEKSKSDEPSIGTGKWKDPHTKEVHKLRYVCIATKFIGVESPQLYDTSIAQAPEHNHDDGKHRCSSCPKYDPPGKGITKSGISAHWKKYHDEVKKIFAEHKVVLFIGRLPEDSEMSF